MYPYQSKPWHLIVSFLFFAFGVFSFGKEWDILGYLSILLGFVSMFSITISNIWDKATEHLIAKRNLIDTARYLDLDRMEAIGLVAQQPKQMVTARVTYEDRFGNLENQSIRDLPISPVKLQTMANHILNGIPFSRREWVESRKLISDGDFRKLKDAFEANRIIALKDPNKPTMGYEFTSAGRAFLRSASSSPSPTPDMDMAQNGL